MTYLLTTLLPVATGRCESAKGTRQSFELCRQPGQAPLPDKQFGSLRVTTAGQCFLFQVTYCLWFRPCDVHHQIGEGPSSACLLRYQAMENEAAARLAPEDTEGIT